MEEEEVWTGVDIEDDSTVDRDLYQVMKDFLKDYFCAEDQGQDDFNEPQDHEPVKDELGGDLRMIPGGRYGCT